MGGNGSMASYLGIPDIGLSTATEMITRPDTWQKYWIFLSSVMPIRDMEM